MNLLEWIAESNKRIQQSALDISNDLETLSTEIKGSILPSNINADVEPALFNTYYQNLGIKDFVGMAIIIVVTAVLIKVL